MVGKGVTSELPVSLQSPQTDVLFYFGNSSSTNPPANTWTSLQSGSGGSFGPEITFGQDMNAALGSASSAVALIKYAVGGTGFPDSLYPATWTAGGDGTPTGDGDHYKNFQTTVGNALTALAAAHPSATIQITGMIWMQGERDANTDADAADYQEDLTNFIADVRSTYGADLPFVIGQLSDKQTAKDATRLATVQTAQANIAAGDSQVALAITHTFGINTDNLHFNSAGLMSMGAAMADEMIKLLTPSDRTVVNIDFSRDINGGHNPGDNPAGLQLVGTGPAIDAGTFWNDIQVNMTDSGDTIPDGVFFQNLTASDGTTATGIDIELTSGFYRAFNATGDHPLQRDRIFAADGDIATLTIKDLDPGKLYDIYLIGAAGWGTNFTLDGVTRYAGGDTYDGTWTEGEEYTVFSGVAPDSNGWISILIQDGEGAIDSFGVLGGLQIVEVPEPATLVLLGLGGLTLLRRRR